MPVTQLCCRDPFRSSPLSFKGKSTTAGQVLVSTGMVDQRTIDKYTREAEAKKGVSWYLAYILDTNDEVNFARNSTSVRGRMYDRSLFAISLSLFLRIRNERKERLKKSVVHASRRNKRDTQFWMLLVRVLLVYWHFVKIVFVARPQELFAAHDCRRVSSRRRSVDHFSS